MKRWYAFAAICGLSFAAQAHAAPTISYTTKGNGDLTGYFGDTPGTSTFDDYFAPFTVSNKGVVTGSLSAAGVYASTYLNFLTADLISTSTSGVSYAITKLPLTMGSTTNPTGLQLGFIDPITILPGTYQLHITGTTGGPGSIASLSGTLNFVSLSPTSPAPEPETWALMILGLGAAGYAMRRQRSGTVISRKLSYA